LQGTEAGRNGEGDVIALVPTSELTRYSTELRSMTSGRGRFTMEHDHYDVVPPALVDKIVKTERQARSA
jgi:elongation factor G